jgi:hypothetical protein
MSRAFFFIVALCGAMLVETRAATKSPSADFETSVVQMEITRKQYDFVQPWNRRVDQATKVGVVVGSHDILTTADFMSDLTLLRLQKNGRGKWYEAQLEWVDYHANLALVTCKDDAFWKGLKPLKIADVTPKTGEGRIGRWRAGAFESKNVDINRLNVKRGKLTNIDLLYLEVDTELQGTGWGEPIVKDGQLIGIASSKEDRLASAIPSSFIKQCLDARKNWKGLGYFAFVWQPAENPATIEYLKLAGDPRGVLITEVPTNEVTSLKRLDLILELDGFTIDQKGDYKDPQYGNLNLECLSTRKHWAGDEVKLKIWRDGKVIETKYRLPKVDYRTEVVPDYVFDEEPEFLLLGGLLFQPVTVPFLRGIGGADWQRRAPFRLTYLAKKKATPDMKTAVVLSSILPDKSNVGYQDARFLILESMNGQKVRNLQDIAEARKHPSGGFHEIVFQKGDSLSRIILDAAETDSATQRIMERYGIPQPQRLN